jgi:hypothetical protein
MDIKLTTLPHFKLINLTDKEYFVKDRPPNSIYNAFMVCKPRNLLLRHTIKAIVENVQTLFYGACPLSPTGPILMGMLANKLEINSELYHLNSGGYIIHRDIKIISTTFPEYAQIRHSVYQYKHTKRYNILWANKQIYR